MQGNSKFPVLFKKYRLRSEFSTFSELGLALAEKGLVYEDSIFSRWQQGSRLPSRAALLRLIEIFSKRQAIRTIEEANEFLESADQGYLTQKELEKLPSLSQARPITELIYPPPRLNISQKILIIYLTILFILWLGLQISGLKLSFWNYFYSFAFALIPLIGGLMGFFIAKSLALLKNLSSKGVFLVSLGLFSWGVGGLIWAYYNFFEGNPAPYPSLADLGFAPSIFLYGLGAIYLSKANNTRLPSQNPYNKIFVILALILLLAISYHLFVTVARGGALVSEGRSALKTFFDITYPFGDSLGLIISVFLFSLSFSYSRRNRLNIISILLGLLVMTIGDAVFSYTTTVGTFYNGQLGDLLLTTGLFLLTLGNLGFYRAKG